MSIFTKRRWYKRGDDKTYRAFSQQFRAEYEAKLQLGLRDNEMLNGGCLTLKNNGWKLEALPSLSSTITLQTAATSVAKPVIVGQTQEEHYGPPPVSWTQEHSGLNLRGLELPGTHDSWSERYKESAQRGDSLKYPSGLLYSAY